MGENYTVQNALVETVKPGGNDCVQKVNTSDSDYKPESGAYSTASSDYFPDTDNGLTKSFLQELYPVQYHTYTNHPTDSFKSSFSNPCDYYAPEIESSDKTSNESDHLYIKLEPIDTDYTVHFENVMSTSDGTNVLQQLLIPNSLNEYLLSNKGLKKRKALDDGNSNSALENRRRRNRERAAWRRRNESLDERTKRLKKDRERAALRRLTFRRMKSPNTIEEYLKSQRERAARIRHLESPEQRERRLKKDRERAAQRRQNFTLEQREEYLRKERERAMRRRRTETPEQREMRLKRENARIAWKRHSESEEQKETRRRRDRERMAASRKGEACDGDAKTENAATFPWQNGYFQNDCAQQADSQMLVESRSMFLEFLQKQFGKDVG